jgi:hypothetical protein
MSVARGRMSTDASCCVVHDVCLYMMQVACCMLHAVCCMLYVVCCMLYVVCCMLHAPFASWSEYELIDASKLSRPHALALSWASYIRRSLRGYAPALQRAMRRSKAGMVCVQASRVLVHIVAGRGEPSQLSTVKVRSLPQSPAYAHTDYVPE